MMFSMLGIFMLPEHFSMEPDSDSNLKKGMAMPKTAK